MEKICTTILASESLMFSNCECDKIYAAEMTNMTDLWLSGVFFQAPNTPKLVFGRGSALNPAGVAYNAPSDPSCVPLPIPFPLDAIGVWRLSAPPTQIPGYTYAKDES